MKNSWLLLLFVCLFLATSCGKSIVEESEKDDTEQPVTPPDDGGDDDDDDDGSGGSDDGGSGGSDDGGSGGESGGGSGDGGSGDGGSGGGNGGGGSGDGGSGGGNDGGGSGDGGSGGGSDDGGSGGIHQGDIISVKQFVSNDVNNVYVHGYVVGDIMRAWSNATFEAPFQEEPVAVLLADDPNERDKEDVMYVKLNKSKGERKDFSLALHPENLHRMVKIFVSERGNSYGICGIDQISAIYYWDE